jgi:hypothetical protein
LLTPAISNRHQKATIFICPSSNSKDEDVIGWRPVQLFRHAILLDFSCHHLSAESSTLAALLLHLEHHLQQLETGETSTFNQKEIRNTNRPIGQRRINWRMDNGYRRMASVNTSCYEKKMRIEKCSEWIDCEFQKLKQKLEDNFCCCKVQHRKSIQDLFNHTVTDRVSGGQSACPGKWKMCRKKKLIVILVWWICIHVCHVSCNVVVMFTCTLVRSRPGSRRHWSETWTVAINSNLPGWVWQQDACS